MLAFVLSLLLFFTFLRYDRAALLFTIGIIER